MCYPLMKCIFCQSVGYCSKHCLMVDWKAGHKDACKQHKQPDSWGDA